MTIDNSTFPLVDPARLAAAARSILSCPSDVQLVVDGIDDITEGLDEAEPGSGAYLGMQDVDGCPMFSCPPTAVLSGAAAEGRPAILNLASGLGQPGSPDREATLTLTGRLEVVAIEDCECCAQVRTQVRLHLDFVMLSRPGDEPDQRIRVPLSAFNSDEHQLNRGFLQRSTEHANHCHQEELRRAVSTTVGTRLRDIVGAGLTDLRSDRVELRWVDVDGAHSMILMLDRPARSSWELGQLLRDRLHAGLC